MRVVKMVAVMAFLMVVISLWAYGAETKGTADSVTLWDTAKHSNASLAPEAVAARDGWKQVADEKASFEGDACLMNNYLALVLRKGCKGAEWYYRLGDKLVKGPTLIPVGAGGDKAKAIESFKLLDHTADSFVLEAASATDSGKKIAVRYLLKKDKPFVETTPGEGAEKILIEMKSQHAVFPDPFGGDLVVTAKDTKESQLRLPSENMLLNLTDNGNAIVQCVWRSGDQDVKISLDGAGDGRAITATEIAYKKDMDMHVWVGVLAAPAIWYQKKAGELNPVKFTKLDWRIPFRALWRADYPRTDGLTDSWKLVIKKEKPGEWEGFGVSLKKEGTVWTASRGTYGYPAHIEHDEAYLRTTKFESLPKLKYREDGLIVIYPFQKTGDHPKSPYGARDFLGQALEETPEFTLPEDMVVKVFPRSRYPGVCYTTGEVEKIFDAKEEHKKKREIIERFYKMNFFNVVVRGRIEEYMDWSKRTHEFCGKEKAQKPQLAPLIDEFDGMTAKFAQEYDHLKLAERTPAAAHVLTDKFVALIESNEQNKDEKAKQLGRDTRVIASNQDHSTGVFRMFTREMRQRAGYRMMEAKDDASFDFAKEIRQRALEMLKNTLGVEGGTMD
jgi:hypothetical protein